MIEGKTGRTTMKEAMGETVSALLDGEANELEMQRLLSQIESDEDLRASLTRYSAVQGVLSGDHVDNIDFDISKSVAAQIAASSVSERSRIGLKERWLRPLSSVAVAASVTAVVVFGGQQLAQVSATQVQPAALNVAAAPSPVGMLNSLGATAVQASYGTQAIPSLQPATRTAYQKLATQRMNRYMQEHAEHAALNSPAGLIPFARVPQIQE